MNREPGWTRIIVHEPPQRGKSWQFSKLFPSFYMGHFPDDPIILTSYNDEHATSFSREIRNIVRDEEYRQLFPHVRIRTDSHAAHRWGIEGYRGEVNAGGILGGAITGKGARLLIMDDPYKNRAEAESAPHREKVVESYKSTLSTRLHAGAIQLLPMTRWHKDDLAGYLLAQNLGFRYIRIPAIADGLDYTGHNQEPDPLGRNLGEPLWPEKYPLDFYNAQKELLGSYDWTSLYQGLPIPPEGMMFSREQLVIIEPRDVPKDLRWVRFWDLATTEDRKADATASIEAAMDGEGIVYLRRGLHFKKEWPFVRARIAETAKAEPGVLVGIEAVGTQKGMVQEMYADPELADIGILGVPVSTSKRIRALPLAARAEAGKLRVVAGDWNESFIREMIEFDSGDHDDWIDAASGCMRLLSWIHGRNLSITLPSEPDPKGDPDGKIETDLIDPDLDLEQELAEGTITREQYFKAKQYRAAVRKQYPEDFDDNGRPLVRSPQSEPSSKVTQSNAAIRPWWIQTSEGD